MEIDSILRPKITRAHIAFVRGWANGVDIGKLASLYLSSFAYDARQMDLRVAKTILTVLLKELAITAARNKIIGSSALLRQAKRIRVDPEPIKEQDGFISFEEYVDTLKDAGEFSEEELRAAYLDAVPEANKANKPTLSELALKRRARLIERQLRLIDQLEKLLAAPMSLEDRVEDWFVLNVANRLVDGGIRTIENLAVAIAADKHKWYAKCTGIGASKADRIELFLSSHLGAIEPILKSRGIALQEKQRAVLTLDEIAAVPSPALAGNSDLDGSKGRLRNLNTPAAIGASNDYEAMETWLSLKQSNVTATLYRREVTRLISWSVKVLKRPMSSLTVEDAIAYRDFLDNIPATAQVKKGPTKHIGASQGGSVIKVAHFTQARLNRSTIKKILVILSGFFNWLVDVQYVVANPFAGVKPDGNLDGVGMGSTDATNQDSLAEIDQLKSNIQSRVLPHEALVAIDSFLDAPPTSMSLEAHARMRFVFKFAYMTGLRISELAAARRAHLQYIHPDPVSGDPGGWYLNVLGKRRKVREVPIPDELIAELERYLAHRGLLALGDSSLGVPDGTFLIGALPSFLSRSSVSGETEVSVDGQTALSKRIKSIADGVRPQTIHLTLKELFRGAMVESRFKDAATVKKMEAASAHWLRHTLCTNAVAADAPLDVVASSLGHANIATTSLYIHTERRRKIAEMQKLWQK